MAPLSSGQKNIRTPRQAKFLEVLLLLTIDLHKQLDSTEFSSFSRK